MLNYEPNMTIPNERITPICFDPLVELDQSIVNDIPLNEPKDQLYTQFFRRNEFNSLLKRTLGNDLSPMYNFKTAIREDIPNNNIKVTLDTLFKSGNPFYINGTPYSINSYNWIPGDWEIGSKPFADNRIRYMPYGMLYPVNYVPNFEKIAKKELESVPVEARIGIYADGLNSKIKKAIRSSVGHSSIPILKQDNGLKVIPYTKPNEVLTKMLTEDNKLPLPNSKQTPGMSGYNPYSQYNNRYPPFRPGMSGYNPNFAIENNRHPLRHGMPGYNDNSPIGSYRYPSQPGMFDYNDNSSLIGQDEEKKQEIESVSEIPFGTDSDTYSDTASLFLDSEQGDNNDNNETFDLMSTDLEPRRDDDSFSTVSMILGSGSEDSDYETESATNSDSYSDSYSVSDSSSDKSDSKPKFTTVPIPPNGTCFFLCDCLFS